MAYQGAYEGGEMKFACLMIGTVVCICVIVLAVGLGLWRAFQGDLAGLVPLGGLITVALLIYGAN